MVATHFSGNVLKIRGFWEFWKKKKPDFFEKNGGTTSCPFSRPPQKWMLFFGFFLLFSVSSASSKRVLKKPYFYRVFAHPSKASSDIMQQQGQKKSTHFFRKPLFFYQKQLSKTLILHHPLKNCAQKISQNPYFYRLKKRWPSYWPYRGQVIDLKMAKMWPSYWPYSIYIYICCGVIILAKFGLLRCYSLGQVCFFTKHCLSQNTIKQGFQHFFWTKNCARKFEVLLSGPSWPLLSCSQLGPDNNTYLAQTITPQNGIFGFFCFLKMCWNTYFIVLLSMNQNWQKMGKKNFSHYAKHRLVKKNRFVATPLLTKNWGFSTLIFWNQKHKLMLNQKHNLRWGKNIDKKGIEKGIEKKNKTGNQKEKKKKLQFNGLMLFLSWNKSKEERKWKKKRKTRNKKKTKKKDEKEKKE